MERLQIQWDKEEELIRVAEELLSGCKTDRIFLLHGDLGAGKTALVRAMAQYLKTTDQVSSPTFSIVNIYHTQTGQKIYHADLYRVKSAEEAWDAGIEEILHEPDAIILIEWPEVIMSMLPDRYIEVFIEADENGCRKLVAVRNN